MRSLPRFLRLISISIRYHWRPLLAYHLFFGILLLALLGPLMGWTLGYLLSLSGISMVGNEDLIRFLVTPLGLLWLLMASAFAATLVFIQHAGMMLLITPNSQYQFPNSSQALWLVALRLPRLLLLALIQVAVHLVLASPLILVLAMGYQRILGEFDIYYILAAKPVEYWRFVALVGVVLLAILVLNGGLYIRWILALPGVIFENLHPWKALRASAVSTRGLRLNLAVLVIGVGLLVAGAPMLLTWLFGVTGELFIEPLPSHSVLVLGLMIVFLVGFAVLGWILGFLGVTANSLLIAKLYRLCRGEPLVPDLPDKDTEKGAWAWGMEGLVVVLALSQLAFAMIAFDDRIESKNIAHRGSSIGAPENSLAAIDLAIEEGADYIELDVRQTRDGTLVLLHDRDLLRLGGDSRDIWQIDYQEIQSFDIGSWFDPVFADQQLVTLSTAIEHIGERTGLYLEIKTQPDARALVRDTVLLLQQKGVTEQTIIAALDPAFLTQVRELEPGLRTALLVHSSIGRLDAQPFDIVALRDALVSPQTLRQLRQSDYEVHVWTVNETRDMARLLGMGVDGIITDRPARLSRIIAEREEWSPIERWLFRLRHWVW